MGLRSVWVLMPIALGGCAAPPGGFDSPVPALRLQATAEAARRDDTSAVEKLIAMLDSDDVAVRFASIGALRRLTGRDFAYDYADPPYRRNQAVGRWVRWYRENGAIADKKTGPGHSNPTEH